MTLPSKRQSPAASFLLTPFIDLLVRGTWYLVLGAWFLVRGSWCVESREWRVIGGQAPSALSCVVARLIDRGLMTKGRLAKPWLLAT